jgi:hypothetical protein
MAHLWRIRLGRGYGPVVKTDNRTDEGNKVKTKKLRREIIQTGLKNNCQITTVKCTMKVTY